LTSVTTASFGEAEYLAAEMFGLGRQAAIESYEPETEVVVVVVVGGGRTVWMVL
jgi:hypothetical protein